MIKRFVVPHIPSNLGYLGAFIIGIISAHFIFYFSCSISTVIKTGVCIATLISLFLYRHRSLSLYSLFLILGFARTTWTLYKYDHYHSTNKTPFVVVDINDTGNAMWPFCTKVNQDSYNMLIYTKLKPACKVGDICHSKIQCKKPIYNSFCHYLLKENCVATAFCFSFKPTVVISERFSFLNTWRHRFLESLSTLFSPSTYALFSSLFLGNKKTVKKDLKEIKVHFRSWGISHHLARSGFHLIIILLGWYFLFSLLPLSYTLKCFLLSVIVALFVMICGGGVSFGRSLSLFFITQFLLSYKKQIHTLYLLIMTALFFLFINPFLLFGLDFQLSFFVTMMLCLFSLINRQKRVNGCKLLLNDYKKS